MLSHSRKDIKLENASRSISKASSPRPGSDRKQLQLQTKNLVEGQE